MKLDNFYKIVNFTRELFDYILNNPKQGAFVLSTLLFVVYMVFTRTPAYISCAREAKVIQSIESENWRFNILPSEEANQCQYRLNKRWIPLKKPATDVGLDDLN